MQGIEAAGGHCVVHRSDRITADEVERLKPDRIVISPGPFGPERTGVCPEVVRRFRDTTPILGVCLGMQVISVAMGARVKRSGTPVHGKASQVWHDGRGVLEGMPNPLTGGRYHSLIVERETLSPALEVSAWTEDCTIMGCRIPGCRTEGVLFHPESFLTEAGGNIFANFLRP